MESARLTPPDGARDEREGSQARAESASSRANPDGGNSSRTSSTRIDEAGAPDRGGRPPDDELIEQAAREIHELDQRTQLAFAYSVGEIVIERLYGGDLSEWRSRGRKTASLRVLADRLTELESISAPTLFRCIATYELLRDAGGAVAWRHVSVTHVRTVLPLHDTESELRLLRRAEDESWSVRQLERHVRNARGRDGAGGRARSVLAGVERIEHDAREIVRRLGSERSERRDNAASVLGSLMRARASLELAQDLVKRRPSA